ncbi:MAG: hypothetical protein ACXAC0_04085 [Candidatus Thorarchaeota archaeon]|jgi:hypothetical protein
MNQLSCSAGVIWSDILSYITTSGVDLVSLKGPLRDKKGYIKTVLEPLDVRLQSMRNRTVGDAIAYYEIIWDTPTAEPRTGEIEITLLSRFDELLFRIVTESLTSQRVIRRVTSRSTRVLFRHTANLEVSVDTSAI